MLKPYAGFISGVITQKTYWTEQLFSIRVAGKFNSYIAGQFVKLALHDEQGELIRRAYSIVNHPKEFASSGELEFLIIANPTGQLSPRLRQLQMGDEILVSDSAAGFMTLDEIPPDSNELWLLSTGTAIGPYLAMLEQPGIEHRFNTIVLVNATRTQAEQSYPEKIQELKTKFGERFTYVPIISRESVRGALSGRIPMLLENGVLFQAATSPPNPTSCFFYLCGNPAMVKESSESLKKLGFRKHLRRQPGQFSSENYW
ncbi:ferredoxin--NADP reductase [Vibrio orientalis CIP 102891 = ATCC 33934]|uniref:ferredoxin--NADP(+) reductase n=1 Tax=Vibrio orientalis CIP 102891 = ATCC 33934 TaxID=675816 RepID=C9QF18_VIBOR|nr:ferredoxin--NADP reductase [Vibrio orientalis]EEX94728.1 ferredoxin--NADP(+) reductase [Vibrio orientalis CIP 102891 = ATCC 33934]EGU51427.1 ferredoxin--NADP reductase [Vibrio orientalis CIP 102891 = ATCC 33934]